MLLINEAYLILKEYDARSRFKNEYQNLQKWKCKRKRGTKKRGGRLSQRAKVWVQQLLS